MPRSVLVFLSLLFLGARSQVSQSVIIDKINTRDLTNQFVSSLYQDMKGYLWVGTLSGLNKYNGYAFSRYRYDPNNAATLSHPAVTCFGQTEADEVFVGTRKGLNIYNYSSNDFKRVLIGEQVKNASLKNNIRCMVNGRGKEMIVGTSDGVFLFSQDKNVLEPISWTGGKLLEGWSVLALCTDRLGNLWASARKNDTDHVNRVFKYSFSAQKLNEIVIDNGYSEHCGISEDYLGNIWVAVDNGLVNINPGTGKQNFYGAPGTFYSNVSYTHAKDNTIWQCYWSFGITSFDIDKKEYKIYKNDPDNSKSLMSNKCWALLKDENDILWIGTDVGLQKITSKRPGIEIARKNNTDEKKSFRSNIITAVLASRKQNNTVFAGIDGEGFSIYNRNTHEAVNYGPGSEIKNSERFVNQFFEDLNGDLFVIGQNSFQKLSFSQGKTSVKSYYNYQEHYGACAVQDPLHPERLWLGCKGEIACFNKNTEKIKFSSPLNINEVFYTAFVAHQKIYFGYRNGLLKLDPETGEFSNVNIPDAGNIRSAQVFSEDEVYLSSQYFGLIKFFTSTGKFEIVYRDKNEYFSEPACLLLYKNILWITGNGGLSGLNILNDEISEISTEDGLPSDVIHQTDLLDGYFYLGTQDGLAIINPDFQVSHFISPKIDITSFQVLADNTVFSNLSSGSDVTLSETQNSFRIDFTVLDFNLPEKNRFKFRMMPVEKEWVKPVAENFVIFNSLPYGNYRFELIGSNADMIWSTEPFVINIHVVPPFYKTTWFYILCISVLILGGITFYFWRISSEHKKQTLLEKIIKERTAEIHAQRAELLDSISYAQRIQKAIFVGENILKENLKESFIYYKPKDKVSGDFYWIGKHKDLLIIFAGDCTGHGVPGAMLSIVGTSLLNKIVHEEDICLPGEILTRLNELFYKQLNLQEDNIRDGMDASVLTVNVVNQTVYFAGAKLDGIYVADGKMTDLKAQRTTIGEHQKAEFTSQNIPFHSQRQFYLFSDGIKDQHGGPDNKKLSGKRFREILFKASALPFEQQKQFISTEVKNWKGELPQTDDMILIGISI